jgi:hypothetical protein
VVVGLTVATVLAVAVIPVVVATAVVATVSLLLPLRQEVPWWVSLIQRNLILALLMMVLLCFYLNLRL